MQEVQWQLKAKNHEVRIPRLMRNEEDAIRIDSNKMLWARAILVLNLEKDGVRDYVGPRTLMEMGLAFFLGRDIYLYGEIPELPWKKEIQDISPILIHGDLDLIKPQ